MAYSPEHTLNHARGLFQAYSQLSHSLIASSSSFLRDNVLDEAIRAWKRPQRWLSTQSLLFFPISYRKKQRRIRNNSPKCYASRPTNADLWWGLSTIHRRRDPRLRLVNDDSSQCIQKVRSLSTNVWTNIVDQSETFGLTRSRT